MYSEIDIDEDGGTIFGYSVNSQDENYKFFLKEEISNEKLAKKIIEYIEKNIKGEINIIKNINVEEEFRGQGIGKSMLEQSNANCEISILISDKYEIQKDNFILDDFYLNNGYEKVLDSPAGSLMIYPKDIALKIKNEIEKPIRKNKIKP